MKRSFWTKEEEEQLRFLYEEKGLGDEEISKIIHRTITGIHVKQKRMRLRHSKSQIRELKSRTRMGDKNPMFGKKGANSGLTKFNSERIKEAGMKISKSRILGYKNGNLKKTFGPDNPRYGSTPWSKGKNKYEDKRLMNMSIIMKKTAKERWNNLSEEEKERRRSLWASQSLKRKYHRSSIEISVEATLKELNIDYIPSYRMGRFILDFWIPSKNICIECNGDYWHCNPDVYLGADKYQAKNIDRDNRKRIMLNEKGFNMLVLWEKDIKLNKSKELIESFLNEHKYRDI